MIASDHIARVARDADLTNLITDLTAMRLELARLREQLRQAERELDITRADAEHTTLAAVDLKAAGITNEESRRRYLTLALHNHAGIDMATRRVDDALREIAELDAHITAGREALRAREILAYEALAESMRPRDRR